MPRAISSALTGHPDLEVLAAVARRGVHEPRAVLVGDVIAIEQGHREIVAATDAFQRMLANESRQVTSWRDRAPQLERVHLRSLHHRVG